jgi:membrane protease YdiL (CAAX protease family)
MADSALEYQEPPAGAPWGLRDMVVAGLATIGLVIVGVVVALVVAVAWSGLGLPGLSPGVQVFLIFGLEALLIVPAWIWGPGKHGGGWDRLGLRPFAPLRGLAWVIGGLVAILAINVVWEGIRQRLGWPGQPDFLPIFGEGVGGLALALFLGGVVAPIAEEVFFRGYLYAGARSRWGVVWGAIASSVVFALVHVTPGVLPPIMVMALIFVILYERTRSIWPCIILHGAVNSLAFIGAFLAERFPEMMG